MFENLFNKLYDKYDKWTEASKVGHVVDKILSAIPFPVYRILGFAVGCVIGRFIYLTFLK